MTQITTGLIYSPEMNKLFYSNDYIVNTGMNLIDISDELGVYAEYISDSEFDLLHARSKNITVFSEEKNDFQYTLSESIDIDKSLENMISEYKCTDDELSILYEEIHYIKQQQHNILLLEMAFILKHHFNSIDSDVYIMRGSGIASFVLYVLGLNKVNPIKFNLDYKNFWN